MPVACQEMKMLYCVLPTGNNKITAAHQLSRNFGKLLPISDLEALQRQSKLVFTRFITHNLFSYPAATGDNQQCIHI